MDVLATAAGRFREQALLGGGWKPELGSSLRSYYVGALVLEFPNAFRRWHTQWRAEDGLRPVQWTDLLELEQVAGRLFVMPAAVDPAHQVAVADLLERTLAAGDDEIRKIAELRKLGCEWQEIGTWLGKNANAASEKWRRFCADIRKQHKERTEGSGEQDPAGTETASSLTHPRRGQPGDRKAEEV
ncbi:hypothetical protein [Streptomyces collinus]|uniref:hypothetical protein n=1 Tax=Streptomyces collinus TaxID=42684 RepID=UPI0034051DC7